MNALVPINRDSCPVCGTTNPAVFEYSDTVDFRGLQLDVESLQESKCRHCGHKWNTRAQRSHNNAVLRHAYGIERDKIRAQEGLLTGQEIARLRERFGINQREAAAIFGGGYNAFNKYESGEVLQSFAMDRLVRLTAAVGMPAIEFLRDVFAEPNFIVVSASQGTTARVSVHVLITNVEAGKYISTDVGSGTQLENLQPRMPYVISGLRSQFPTLLEHNHR